jgi:ABC-2 type transport system permease protein
VTSGLHGAGELAAAAAVQAPVEMGARRRFYWSLRRELWESRSLYLAPLAVGVLILLGSLIGALRLPEKMRAAASLAPAQRHEAIAQPFMFASLLLMATTFVVAVFYCLDALQSERRDRSILFWKSLPVSDLTTVLAKASLPLVILPLLTVAIAVAVHLVMLLVSTAVLLASGHGAAALWTEVSPPEMWLMLLYHMVTVHALWYAPIYGWLLFVSAWSQRAAWLWATLPLLAIGVVERIAFGSSLFADMMARRFAGGMEGAEFTTDSMTMAPLMQLMPGRFLASPGLWLGLAVAAAFLAGAVRLRRQRGPV